MIHERTIATTAAAPTAPTEDVAGEDVEVSLARHLLVIAAAALIWVWSVGRVDEAAMGDLGMLTILPLSTYIAIAMMIVGFASVVRIDFTGRVQGLYVIGLTVMLHGLPTFAYEHLRFGWAWKHVGIVEYIQRVGDVDPNIDSLAVYHNWPGFFGLNAWIAESSQLDSALSYAAWAPLLFNLLFVGALYVMFKAFTTDLRLVWTSVLIFVLGNWVGQDYFAPQALAYFLYLLVMAIMFRWYQRPPKKPRRGSSTVPDPEVIRQGSAASYAIAAVLVMSFVVMVVSHQLTPIVTIVALAGLVVFRVVRVRWPLFVMIGLTVAWLAGPARDIVMENLTGLVEEVGGVTTNLDQNLVDADVFNETQLFISQVSRLLSAAVFGLGALGFLRRWFRKVPSGWAVLLAMVPGVLVVMGSYGGEVIFRAYLFALPFAAFLAASLWFPDHGTGTRRFARVTLAATLLVLTAGLMIANFGADLRQVFTDEEVAASAYVFENARPGALLIEGSRDYPRQFRNYEDFVYLGLDRSTRDTLDGLLVDPAARLAVWLGDDERYNGGLIVITQSQRDSVTQLGTLLSPTLDTIEASLLASDEFEVVFQAGDAVVFAPVGQQ